jgi:hypothetical protein
MIIQKPIITSGRSSTRCLGALAGDALPRQDEYAEEYPSGVDDGVPVEQ